MFNVLWGDKHCNCVSNSLILNPPFPNGTIIFLTQFSYNTRNATIEQDQNEPIHRKSVPAVLKEVKDHSRSSETYNVVKKKQEPQELGKTQNSA